MQTGLKKAKYPLEGSLQQATEYSSIILMIKKIVMVAGFVNIGHGL
jgi:hypothetical protein